VARFGVMLDANVLVPITLTDTLLHIAEHGMYQPLWSERILDETLSTLKVLHPTKAPLVLERRIARMNNAFPQACVSGWEHLVEGLVGICPDPDDAHVVAAAIFGQAEIIVTSNLKDFPQSLLEPLGMQAISPDDFLLDQLDLNHEFVMESLQTQALNKKRPPLTLMEIAAQLEQLVPKFVAEVRHHFPTR
jgi:predicted nucleic acid-binding protein